VSPGLCQPGTASSVLTALYDQERWDEHGIPGVGRWYIHREAGIPTMVGRLHTTQGGYLPYPPGYIRCMLPYPPGYISCMLPYHPGTIAGIPTTRVQ